MVISISDLPEENRPKPVIVTIGADYDMAKHISLMELAKSTPVIVHSTMEPTLGKLSDFERFDVNKVIGSDFILSLTRALPTKDETGKIFLTKIKYKDEDSEKDNE